MAITGVSAISGMQILASGACSAKSAATASYTSGGNNIQNFYNHVNTASGSWTGASNPQIPVTSTSGISIFDSADKIYFNISADYALNSDLQNISAEITGMIPELYYTDNGLISAIDARGLYATSALEAKSANSVKNNGSFGTNIRQYAGADTSFYYMPTASPFGTPTGIFSPLQYATGACLAMDNGKYAAYFKANEWFVSNTTAGQALRGETHQTRGVHLSGATTAGYSFDLNISAVSGKNDTANGYNWKLERGCVSGKGVGGEWRYGPAEDAALRAVSSCDMHESAFGYDANDKISGYNGSAFAGGSDVPEGVMVESGLEYNAVQEISGYNGSAIAQYGAEKQWLQHDDTLVHAANSAQYALGVNVSAVAQLLGIDETELLASTATSAFTLTEPVSSFKAIKIKMLWWDKDPNCYYNVQHFSNTGIRAAWMFMDKVGDVTPLEHLGCEWSSNDGLTYTQINSVAIVENLTTGVGRFTVTPTAVSIIGIGRKQ